MRPLAPADHFCFRLFGLIAAPLLLLGTALVPASAQDAAPAAEPAAQTEPTKAEEAPKTDAAKESTDGEFAGQEDLNAAIDTDAEDLDTLQRVIDLLKSALSKGISEGDVDFAKKMIGSTALKKAELLIAQLQESRLGQQGQLRVINEVEKALKLCLEYDPKQIDAYIQLASLHFGLQRQGEARDELTKAIELAEADHKDAKDIAKLYITRARMQSDSKAQMDDLTKASELDPANPGAWQSKVQMLYDSGDKEGAYQVVLGFLKTPSDNLKAIELAIGLLLDLDKADDALRILDEKIPQLPSSSGLLRFRGRAKQKIEEKKFDESAGTNINLDAAIADYTAALELSPMDVVSYRWRGEAYEKSKKFDEALRDVEKALSIKPDDLEAVLLRVSVATNQGHIDEAISDVERLVRKVPHPSMFAQLAQLYLADDRPRLAIQTCDEVLKAEPNFAPAYRIRGDAFLSTGEQEKAITDLEKCLELIPKDNKEQRFGVLNNLSWVLATSPKDEVRDGDRALELALEACELSDYKKAHVLSTLAAAYAEKGDFEKAREWSAKAVELGKVDKSEQTDQLEQELKSYQENKPWRELQETTESAKPSVQIEKGVDA